MTDFLVYGQTEENSFVSNFFLTLFISVKTQAYVPLLSCCLLRLIFNCDSQVKIQRNRNMMIGRVASLPLFMDPHRLTGECGAAPTRHSLLICTIILRRVSLHFIFFVCGFGNMFSVFLSPLDVWYSFQE